MEGTGEHIVRVVASPTVGNNGLVMTKKKRRGIQVNFIGAHGR
jgi:hypothetical protein